MGRTVAPSPTYPASAFRIPTLIFTAASDCMPGITLLYTSKVMPHVGVSEALLHDLGTDALT